MADWRTDMNKQYKRLFTLGLIACLSVSSSMLVFAGEWKEDETGWWYEEGDKTYPKNQWKEINGKQYYFDGNGYMLHDTTTPDGYKVGADGAWITNGVTQTQKFSTDTEDFDLLRYYSCSSVPTDKRELVNAKIAEHGLLDRGGVEVQVKDWIYSIASSDIVDINGNPMQLPDGGYSDPSIRFKLYLIRVKEDGSSLEILREFFESKWKLSVPNEMWAAQGKICFYIMHEEGGGEPVTLVDLGNGSYTFDTGDYKIVKTFYQYDIANQTIEQTTEEANKALIVDGKYDPVYHRYYTYDGKKQTLYGKTLKGELVEQKKIVINDIPQFWGKTPTLGLFSVEGDIIKLSGTVSHTVYNGGSTWNLPEEYQTVYFTVNKQTGEVLDKTVQNK